MQSVYVMKVREEVEEERKLELGLPKIGKRE